MKLIPLTQNKVAIVDDADFESASRFDWYAHKMGRRFYANRNVPKPGGGRMTLLLHRFLLPEAKEIDHIDGDGLNNQRANLRSVSRQQNQQAFQRKCDGASSRFRGVTWDKASQKWRAQIKLDGKNIHLGYFQAEQDAARAYSVAAKQYFGKFAQSNI